MTVQITPAQALERYKPLVQEFEQAQPMLFVVGEHKNLVIQIVATSSIRHAAEAIAVISGLEPPDLPPDPEEYEDDISPGWALLQSAEAMRENLIEQAGPIQAAMLSAEAWQRRELPDGSIDPDYGADCVTIGYAAADGHMWSTITPFTRAQDGTITWQDTAGIYDNHDEEGSSMQFEGNVMEALKILVGIT